MRSYWDFYSAAKLLFGNGVMNRVGPELQKETWTRPLIITDKNLVNAGIVDRIKTSIRNGANNGVVFDESEAEPSLNVATKAHQVAQEYNPDVIIGLGGGSNMDLAKMTALLHAHGGCPEDYFGFDQVPGPVTPLICIPTTAGTGSEVSHAAVLTDTKSDLKVSTLSRHLRPALALVDPELTLTCPAHVTAESGMDALTHAIEAFTARHPSDLAASDDEDLPYPGKNPMADAFAEKAIRLIGKHLERVIDYPDDIKAREGMALAATSAGLAFSNGAVAIVHALEYPMGVALHCSHGQGNGLLLPYVMRFNLSARKETFAKIANFLGCETNNLSVDQAANAAIEKVESIKKKAGIPGRIRNIGGNREQLASFADKSIQINRLMDINPIQPSREDLLSILESAY
ncbi:MAG: iron-containing alcohol dehydrogenase [Verrucomicrobia bacterium]|jgi:alcohol dehydrogenase|nr:iron-containing alcohol dehydrogenase [Verrucomicrobiota bacterium]